MRMGVCLTFGLAAALAVSPNVMTVTNLRCEYQTNPLGVDVPNPRLFWKLESPMRGQRQTAYQILVASSADVLAKDKGDLWDSGKVASDETIQIPYRGQPLKSSQQVFWKVRVWDKDGKASAWSQPASWTMGVLNDADRPSPGGFGVAGWQAQWIGATATNSATLLLRREFMVKPARSAPSRMFAVSASTRCRSTAARWATIC